MEQRKFLTAYLEGVLQIFIGNKLFFNQSGILLIELAFVIKRWLKILKSDKSVDFVYDTMDHDEPILKMEFVKSNNYRIESVWQEIEVKELLSEADIVAECERYLYDLSAALKLQLGVELSDITNE